MTQTGVVTAGEHLPAMTRSARSLTARNDAVTSTSTRTRGMAVSPVETAEATAPVTVTALTDVLSSPRRQVAPIRMPGGHRDCQRRVIGGDRVTADDCRHPRDGVTTGCSGALG